MALSTTDPESLAATGNLLCGGVVADGRVYDVTAFPEGFGAGVAFQYEGDNPETVRIVATLDGTPIVAVPADSGSLSFPTPETGSQRLVLSVQRDHFEGFIDDAGDLAGRRAILRWPAATASDLAGYIIYSNGGSGSTYAEIGRSTDVAPDVTFRAVPTSGTGEGVLSIQGTYNGTATNALWRILLGSPATTFQVDPGTGSYGAALTLYEGLAIDIGSGLSVAFDSSSGAFVAADRWDFRVGPRREYVTEELEPGIYNFKVSSFDAAGNESSLSSAVAISIDPAPRAPTGFAVSYASGTNTFTFTWTDPEDADLAAIRIYTDFSTDFGDFEGEVIYDAPIVAESPGNETTEFTPAITAPEGTYRFVARAVDTEGRESANADAISIVLPVSSVGIGVPFELTVLPGPGGVFLLEWSYDLRDGAVTHFDIYVNTSSSSPTFSSALASPAASISSAGIFSQAYTTGAYTNGATRYFTVRARNATLTLASVNVDLTAGIADDSAPSAPASLEGLPQ